MGLEYLQYDVHRLAVAEEVGGWAERGVGG